MDNNTAPRPRARPRIYFTDEDKLDATRKWALRWKYKQEGVPEDEIDAKIELKKKARLDKKRKHQEKLKKKELLLKMKAIMDRVKNDVDDLEHLTMLVDKCCEFECIISEDSE